MNPETTPERGKGDLVEFEIKAGDVAHERWRRTAIAAFYRAEARGFEPGRELEDWYAAERELDLLDLPRADAKAGSESEPQAEQAPKEAKPSTRKRSTGDSGTRGRKSTRSMGTDVGGMA